MSSQPISSNIAAAPDAVVRPHSRSLQITALAVSILMSLFLMVVLPWEIAFPISGALILIGAVICFCPSSCEVYDDGSDFYEPAPVFVERRPGMVFLPPPPPPAIILDGRPRAPVGGGFYTPIRRDVMIDSGPRAPTGGRIISPMMHQRAPNEMHAPVGHDGHRADMGYRMERPAPHFAAGGMHAPVGRRS